MHPELIERLSRQTLLPQIGEEGRDRIAAARFLVIGAGGLGSPALQYLAASGVSVSTLSRQLLHDESRLGMNKAESAAVALSRINPFAEVTSVARYVSEEELASLARQSDVVLDCSDNLATRFAVNDACEEGRHTACLRLRRRVFGPSFRLRLSTKGLSLPSLSL